MSNQIYNIYRQENEIIFEGFKKENKERPVISIPIKLLTEFIKYLQLLQKKIENGE